jgi:hypothetical protein
MPKPNPKIVFKKQSKKLAAIWDERVDQEFGLNDAMSDDRILFFDDSVPLGDYGIEDLLEYGARIASFGLPVFQADTTTGWLYVAAESEKAAVALIESLTY